MLLPLPLDPFLEMANSGIGDPVGPDYDCDIPLQAMRLSQRAELTSATWVGNIRSLGVTSIHKRHDCSQGCSVPSHHLDSSHQAVTWPYWGSMEPPLPAMIISASVCSYFFPDTPCVPMPMGHRWTPEHSCVISSSLAVTTCTSLHLLCVASTCPTGSHLSEQIQGSWGRVLHVFVLRRWKVCLAEHSASPEAHNQNSCDKCGFHPEFPPCRVRKYRLLMKRVHVLWLTGPESQHES